MRPKHSGVAVNCYGISDAFAVRAAETGQLAKLQLHQLVIGNGQVVGIFPEQLRYFISRNGGQAGRLGRYHQDVQEECRAAAISAHTAHRQCVSGSVGQTGYREGGCGSTAARHVVVGLAAVGAVLVNGDGSVARVVPVQRHPAVARDGGDVGRGVRQDQGRGRRVRCRAGAAGVLRPQGECVRDVIGQAGRRV